MLIIKVLKRRDGSSVVVAIILAMLLMTLITSWSLEATNKLTNGAEMYGGMSGLTGGWKNTYLYPAVSTAVQLVVLEILLWIWVGLHYLVTQKMNTGALKLSTKSKKK